MVHGAQDKVEQMRYQGWITRRAFTCLREVNRRNGAGSGSSIGDRFDGSESSHGKRNGMNFILSEAIGAPASGTATFLNRLENRVLPAWQPLRLASSTRVVRQSGCSKPLAILKSSFDLG
jgi:hypothetical protein